MQWPYWTQSEACTFKRESGERAVSHGETSRDLAFARASRQPEGNGQMRLGDILLAIAFGIVFAIVLFA